jgi:hypothetical protein
VPIIFIPERSIFYSQLPVNTLDHMRHNVDRDLDGLVVLYQSGAAGYAALQHLRTFTAILKDGLRTLLALADRY